jgi:hypothetical protein
VAKQFLAAVVEMARKKDFVSDEHFKVDGTLLEAWASAKNFQPKEGKKEPPPDDPGNPTVNFRGQWRSNETHASTTLGSWFGQPHSSQKSAIDQATPFLEIENPIRRWQGVHPAQVEFF